MHDKKLVQYKLPYCHIVNSTYCKCKVDQNGPFLTMTFYYGQQRTMFHISNGSICCTKQRLMYESKIQLWFIGYMFYESTMIAKAQWSTVCENGCKRRTVGKLISSLISAIIVLLKLNVNWESTSVHRVVYFTVQVLLLSDANIRNAHTACKLLKRGS